MKYELPSGINFPEDLDRQTKDRGVITKIAIVVNGSGENCDLVVTREDAELSVIRGLTLREAILASTYNAIHFVGKRFKILLLDRRNSSQKDEQE